MHRLIHAGKSLAYAKEGQGDTTLLFLHGFAESHSIWKAQIAWFSSNNFQVIAVDLPGFGGSDSWPVVSIDEMASMVQEVLLKEKISRCLVFGHSMGGYVALSLVEQFPETYSGLGLIHSHPFADSEEKVMARKKSIDFIRQTGKELYLKQLFPGLFPTGYAQKHPDIIEILFNEAMHFSSEGIMAALEAMASRTDKSRVLENFLSPVLFILGMEDQLIPPSEEMLRQTYFPDRASIHLLEGIGHMSMFEAPEKLNPILDAYIVLCR